MLTGWLLGTVPDRHPGLSAELGRESEKLNSRVLVSVRLKNKGQECSEAKCIKALQSSMKQAMAGRVGCVAQL